MKNYLAHILVSPLDWGLGHASRCVPIIRFLLQANCKVSVAASGLSLQLLQSNFKDEVQFFECPAYQISYPKQKKFFSLKILSQIPNIQKTIFKERQFLNQIIQEEKIDAVISDNRYGMYHSKIPSVILTHQWQILSGMKPWIDHLLLKWHEKKLNVFSQVWIVDTANEENSLAGKLAHPKKGKLAGKVHYLGHLSQLKTTTFPTQKTALKNILVLLSGPEPMRTQLFEILWQQASQLDSYKFVFIAGSALPLQQSLQSNIEFHTVADAAKVRQEMEKADLIICRSGYSSLMDLKAMHAKALLIPTPGQTEQIYLAARLQEQGKFLWVHQDKIKLKEQIQIAFEKPGFSSSMDNSCQDFQKIIQAWLAENFPKTK